MYEYQSSCTKLSYMSDQISTRGYSQGGAFTSDTRRVLKRYLTKIHPVVKKNKKKKTLIYTP